MKKADSLYLSAPGAWALAFGCSVGWGAFVMPGTVFLPVAGPVGTALGITIGGLVMLILGVNYHYLMNRYADCGGTYTYTKNSFGYDHGFLCAWFLILTYIAIIWANASALPLIARTVLGSTFQFGFDYTIAGFHIYLGEILLAVASLVIAAFLCLNRKLAERAQILMAVLLLGGIVICFAAVLGKNGGVPDTLAPHYLPDVPASEQVFTIFSLAPWAFVGFESISHSTAEAKFPLKHSLRILSAAVAAAVIAYAFLALMAASALPEGCGSWLEYVSTLGNYEGTASQPTFFAASAVLGTFGVVLLGTASLCAIFTGLVGNYIALSRLVCALAEDRMVPAWSGRLDKNGVPRNAILSILGISAFLPFLGRTAISWIVDVTTIGATIAYAFASASAFKTAGKEGNRLVRTTGFVGIFASLLFALEFLIPNLLSVKTLATESYLILAGWGILGFVYCRYLLFIDKERRLGRSIVAWVVLLGLIIFTSSIWMRQATEKSLEQSVKPIEAHYTELVKEAGGEMDAEDLDTSFDYLQDVLGDVDHTLGVTNLTQMAMIVMALLILFGIYAHMQKREKQIEVEKALAEESSRAKTSFLSNMSHEIRTPMNAIIGLDNIALRDPEISPKTREQLEKIGGSAKHLLGLINDILDMSRIESGRMVLKNEEFAFREFLDQINVMINGQCQDKGLHYECHIIGETRDYYYGDDMKLKQVLINILGNSVKFTDTPGDVSLTIEETAVEEGQCTLRFVMKDTGIGMDEEYIPKIFEAFSQEDATSTNRYGGSGLGMAITKNFVEMMGGRIFVESRKGVGSTFTVVVPLGLSERSAQDEHGYVLPENLRTMVVDDDEIACEHNRMVLKAVGIECTALTDPAEALRLIREAHDQGQDYQLLLTDFRMPEMNGLELTRAVREFDGGRTAIIMLTGYAWDMIEADTGSAGVDGFIAKPLFSDTLSPKIHSVLLEKEGMELVAPHVVDVDAPEKVLAGRRVLMAEDVDQNAEILEDLLDLEEMTAERAQNGEVAVRMFSEKPENYYDFILMDVRMPVMDGLTATEHIRALPRPDARTIPIIAMTANVFDEDVEHCLKAGMNVHLSKPIEPDRLYRTLAKLIMENDVERIIDRT